MNILLLEDHPIFRFGVRELIVRRWPDAMVSEAETLAKALAMSREIVFQLAVVDLNLPDSDGLEVVSQLMRARPKLRMLVLSLNAESAYAQRALKLGAAGYLTKDHAADELTVALERIASGRRYISQALAEQLADLSTGERAPQAHEGLSDQEYRVLLQLAGGKRVGEIAETMRLSPKTISTYRSRLLEKLRVKSNAELARYAVSHGLLDEHS